MSRIVIYTRLKLVEITLLSQLSGANYGVAPLSIAALTPSTLLMNETLLLLF